MHDKQDVMNYYWHRDFHMMPSPADEETVMPVCGFYEKPPANQPGKDWFGCSWIKTEGQMATCPDPSGHILDDICDWRDVVKFPDLEAHDWEQALVADRVEERRGKTLILRSVVMEGPWERLHCLMGFENALCALMEDPEECAEYFAAMADYKIALVKKVAAYYRPDVIEFHDDWGTQTGPFFSPETWRELIKPNQKRICDAVHECGLPIELHCCGKYDEIIPEFPEVGIDVLQCMDINDIGAAIEATDGKMCFHPTVHGQDFYAMDQAGQLTEEQVRETVRAEFMAWGATGKYAAKIHPSPAWFDQIIAEEYEMARQKLAK